MANLAFAEGVYKATLSKGVLGKGKNYPQIVFTFTCQGRVDPRVDPARPGDLEACPDYERSIFRAISENTIDYVVQDLERLGYPYQDFDHLEEGHKDQHSFDGVEVEVRCHYETYEGKQREKWEFTGGGSGLKVEKLASAEVRKLNALFGKKLKKGSNGPAKPAAKAPSRPLTAEEKSTADQAAEVF